MLTYSVGVLCEVVHSVKVKIDDNTAPSMALKFPTEKSSLFRTFISPQPHKEMLRFVGANENDARRQAINYCSQFDGFEAFASNQSKSCKSASINHKMSHCNSNIY